MINTPGVYNWLSRIRARDIDKEARDAGAKMYMMAGLFPLLPAQGLMDVATGKAEIIIDEEEETVTIIYDDPKR
jgi:hypothetical protein